MPRQNNREKRNRDQKPITRRAQQRREAAARRRGRAKGRRPLQQELDRRGLSEEDVDREFEQMAKAGQTDLSEPAVKKPISRAGKQANRARRQTRTKRRQIAAADEAMETATEERRPARGEQRRRAGLGRVPETPESRQPSSTHAPYNAGGTIGGAPSTGPHSLRAEDVDPDAVAPGFDRPVKELKGEERRQAIAALQTPRGFGSTYRPDAESRIPGEAIEDQSKSFDELTPSQMKRRIWNIRNQYPRGERPSYQEVASKIRARERAGKERQEQRRHEERMAEAESGEELPPSERELNRQRAAKAKAEAEAARRSDQGRDTGEPDRTGAVFQEAMQNPPSHLSPSEGREVMMDEGEVPRAGTTQIMRVYRYLQSIGIDQPTLDQVQQLTEQAGWEASLQDVTVALHNELREESPEPEGRQQGDATQSGDVSAPEMDASEAFPSLGQMSGQKEGTPLSQKTSQPITRRKTLAVGGGGGEMVRGIQPQGAGQGQGGEESRGAVELDNGVIVPNAKIDELAEREGTTWGQMAEILRRDALQRGTA